MCNSKYIEQAMVNGDRRPFLSALVIPSPLALEAFAREQGIALKRYTDVLDHPEVVKCTTRKSKRALSALPV